MRFIVFMFLCTLTSCFSENVFHDERLGSYAISVKNGLSDNGIYIDLNNVSLIIKDGLSDDGYWGLSKGNIVYIDESIFNRKTDGVLSGHIQIEMLLLHEIGHNLLGLKHWDPNDVWPHEGHQVMKTGTWQKIANEESKGQAYNNIAIYFNMR